MRGQEDRKFEPFTQQEILKFYHLFDLGRKMLPFIGSNCAILALPYKVLTFVFAAFHKVIEKRLCGNRQIIFGEILSIIILYTSFVAFVYNFFVSTFKHSFVEKGVSVGFVMFSLSCLGMPVCPVVCSFVCFIFYTLDVFVSELNAIKADFNL